MMDGLWKGGGISLNAYSEKARSLIAFRVIDLYSYLIYKSQDPRRRCTLVCCSRCQMGIRTSSIRRQSRKTLPQAIPDSLVTERKGKESQQGQ